MKNNNLIKNIIHKYKKYFIFFILLVTSIFVSFYFASAINDDDDKYKVSNITITNIQDGTPMFNDSTDTSGNDANGSNGVVRTHDSIIYEVSYNLSPKENQTPNLSDNRRIVVDVLIPTKVEGFVNGAPLQNIFGNYSYAEFETEETVSETTKTITISIDDINASTNTLVNPKIYIREKTDSSTISINDLPEDKKGSFEDAITVPGFSDFTPICNNNSSNTCETRVTSREDYVVNVFKGALTKSEGQVTTPIGYMVGLKSGDGTGIKGKSIPSTVQFTINSVSKIGESVIDNSAYQRSYSDSIDQDITDNLSMCDGCQEKLIPVSISENAKNGSSSIQSTENGSITIQVSNIYNYSVPLDGDSYYAFSTGELQLYSQRIDSSIVGDIETSISSTVNSNVIIIVDNQERYIGAYTSTINIVDSHTNDINGKNIINYGEDFEIIQNMEYATTGGDNLDSLTNYVKIDNDAINLINFEDGTEGNKSIDAYLTSGSDHIIPNIDNGDITFYYGEWTTDYFEPTNEAGCPSDISSKETIMNLYGGPCISAKANALRPYNDLSYEESKGPLLVKVTFRSNDTMMIKNSRGRIKLKGVIYNSSSLINTTHQIVSSAIGGFIGTGETSPSIHYLSSVANIDGTDLIKNANNYIKTNYDFDNKAIITPHSNICGSVACAISGNTIIVSAARTTNPTIKTTYNGKDKPSFYYYPIEWNIDTSGYVSDNTSSLSKLTVDLYLPSYLVHTSSEAIVTHAQGGEAGERTVDINPIITDQFTFPDIRNPLDTNADSYIKYTYEMNLRDDFNNVIPKLKIYTNIKLNTPNVYKFFGYAVVNYETVTNKINPDSTVVTVNYETIEPVRDRSSSVEVTANNNAAVTTQGALNKRYMEKNSSYEYQMQAYNNSGNAINNVGMYYVLPYKGDSAYEDLQSKFEATDFKVKLKESLPTGYKAYYNTSGTSSNIIDNEIHPELTAVNSWIEWANPTEEISEVKAIKIVKESAFANNDYFAGENGITIEVTPVGSNIGDIYYNQFYMITGTSTDRESYPSSRDKVSVYNRSISGFVWEDYDYDGLFNDEESKLENIPVSLYRISDDLVDFDPNDPSTFVGKDGEEWISDTTTDSTGRYQFIGLSEGRYYAKFTYDGKKYTVTKRDATNPDGTPASSINSKARAYVGGNIAISNVVTFDALYNSSYSSLNLGLSIKKEFVVDVKNYIKNVTITSSTGTNSYDYDKATKVSITLKNTNNKTARVTYDFVVENTKYFPGYVGLIQDIMPQGMTFNSNLKENQDWVLSGGALYYTGLSGKLLVPNEKYTFSLVLDFDIKTGGNYINFVSLENLVLMGDEVPEFDFNTSNSGEGE